MAIMSLESLITQRVEKLHAFWPHDPILTAWRQNWIDALVEESHRDEFFGISQYRAVQRCVMVSQLIPYLYREETTRILYIVVHAQDNGAKLWEKDKLVTYVYWDVGIVPADRDSILECCDVLVRCKLLCENEHHEISITDEGRTFMRAFGLDEEAGK